jgi:hypothetical protein
VGNLSRISFAEGIFDAFLDPSNGSAQLFQSTIPTSLGKASIPTLCPLSEIPFQNRLLCNAQQYAHLKTSIPKMKAICTSKTVAKRHTSTQYNKTGTKLASTVTYVRTYKC